MMSPIQGQEAELENSRFAWVFAYYMSYDNDLDVHTDKILDDLQRGVRSDKVAVAVQSDSQRQEGMTRISIQSRDGQSKRESSAVESDDSASISQLRSFLSWVRENFDAERYAITFLNHGGGLNQMCLDEWTGREGGQKSEDWLMANEVGRALADFHDTTGGRVELLFLQQCGRGTLENLYNFRRSASYVLASQFSVGAPNTYYPNVLRAVSRYPEMDGIGLAEKIAAQDEDYISYVLVSTEELRQLPDRLGELLQSFGAHRLTADRASLLKTFGYRHERFFDLESALKGIEIGLNEEAQAGVQRFLLWYKMSLVLRHGFGPRSSSRDQQASGLSIYIPRSPAYLDKYSFLPFYQNEGMTEFAQTIAQTYQQVVEAETRGAGALP